MSAISRILVLGEVGSGNTARSAARLAQLEPALTAVFLQASPLLFIALRQSLPPAALGGPSRPCPALQWKR